MARAETKGYAERMRLGLVAACSLSSLVTACGGKSALDAADSGSTSVGGGRTNANGGSTNTGAADPGPACGEPSSAIPDLGTPPIQPHDSLSSFELTLANQCGQTVWPAWRASGGLDNSVVDAKLWLPLPPATERVITVYSSVGELGFWGRTGCSFDRNGNGACATGDCRGFACPTQVLGFPRDATVFDLERGFTAGYNLPLKVAGTACGEHECAVAPSTCSAASQVRNACGETIACKDACSDVTASCCSDRGRACGPSQAQGELVFNDLLLTFCP